MLDQIMPSSLINDELKIQLKNPFKIILFQSQRPKQEF